MRKLLFILLFSPLFTSAQSIGVTKTDSSLNITNVSGTNTKFKSSAWVINYINAVTPNAANFVTTNTTQTISAASKTFNGTIFTSAVAPITDLSASLGNIASLRYLNIYVAKVFTNNIQSLTSDITFLNTSSVGIGKIFNSTGNFTWGGTTDVGWRLDIVGNGTNGGIRATNITSTDLTASKAVFTDANKKLTSTGPGTSSQVILGDGTLGTYSGGGGFTNPMTTLGDIIYGGASGAATRLAGNTATSMKFLTSTGSGSISAAPVFYDLFGNNSTWTGVPTFTFGAVINGLSNLNWNYGTFSTNVGVITSTANRTINFPDASGTVVLNGANNTFTGINTFNQNVVISPGLGVTFGNSFFTQILLPGSVSSNRTITMPDASGVMALTSDIAALVDNILSKTGDYTIVSGDFVAGKKRTLDLYVDATSANVTITLPSATTFAGYTVYITKIDASVNTVTINTLLGGSTLITQYQSRQANSNATNWYNH